MYRTSRCVIPFIIFQAENFSATRKTCTSSAAQFSPFLRENFPNFLAPTPPSESCKRDERVTLRRVEENYIILWRREWNEVARVNSQWDFSMKRMRLVCCDSERMNKGKSWWIVLIERKIVNALHGNLRSLAVITSSSENLVSVIGESWSFHSISRRYFNSVNALDYFWQMSWHYDLFPHRVERGKPTVSSSHSRLR